MAGASFDMDTGKFMAGITRAIAHFDDRRQLAAEIGEAMVASTQQRFRDQEGPDGASWPKSRRAEEEGGQTLTDTARLRRSINYEATPDMVAWGTNVEYASTHQDGREIVPKKGRFLKFPGAGGKEVFVKKVTVPARPFLGVSDDDLEEARETTASFMARGFGERK